MSQPPSSELLDIAARPPLQERCLKEDGLQCYRLDWAPRTPQLLRDAILVTEAKPESPFICSSAGVKKVLNRIATLCTETKHVNIYLDLQGNYLGRTGTISILQLYVKPLNEVYLLDINALGAAAFTISTNDSLCLKNLLQDEKIKKALFDLRQNSAALYALYGIKLQGVIDVQVMHCAIADPTKCVLSLKKCVSELPFKLHAVTGVKDKGHSLYKDNGGAIFDERPLPPKLLQYCVKGVVLLAALYRQCEPKMTPNLWRNCNNVFHIQLEMSLAEDFDVSPKSSKFPWALHKKGSPKGLSMHDTTGRDTTGEDTALGLDNTVDRTPVHADLQKQDEHRRQENSQTSPTVVNTSPASRSSQQKQGPTMTQGGASESGYFTERDDEELGCYFEDSLVLGESLPTQGDGFASASDLGMCLVEEAADAIAQRARAQASFNSSDSGKSSFLNLSISEPPQMLPAYPPQSTLSSLTQFINPQQDTILGPQEDTLPGSSPKQPLEFLYYPGQTRMLDSSFDQSIIRAPTPQPDFSRPSPERRVSVTRRPAAMDGIAQAFRDEQLYSDTASFNTGGILTSSSSSGESGESDNRSMVASQRQTNMAQEYNMAQFVPTPASAYDSPSPPVPEWRNEAKSRKHAESEESF